MRAKKIKRVGKAGGHKEAALLEDIPVDAFTPHPEYVIVSREVRETTASGLHLPQGAMQALIARKVGEEVKHVQEGDYLVLARSPQIHDIPMAEGGASHVAAILGESIISVVRDFDWESHAERCAPSGLVSVTGETLQ